MQHRSGAVILIRHAIPRLPYAAVGDLECVGRERELVLEDSNGLLLLHHGVLQWRNAYHCLFQPALDKSTARLPLNASRHGAALQRILTMRCLLKMNPNEMRSRELRR